MTPFHIEQTFRGTREKFWQVLFHPEYPATVGKLTGVKSHELLELTDHGDRITRVIRSEPKRDLPAAVRKITGASLVYVERATLYKAEHRQEFTVELEKLQKRADIAGRYTLEEVEPGVIRRVGDASIEIKVPLLGKRIEKAVVEDLTNSHAITAKVIQSWLDGEMPG